MNVVNKLTDFIRFAVQSTNQHGIHSPYLFELYNNVIDDDKRFYDFDQLEGIRKSYLENSHEIEIIELGAGSSYGNHSSKPIKTVAKQQLSSPYQLRVLYRLIDWVGAQNIVELGASLGLSSLYLASVGSKNEVHSFEGNPHFIRFIEYQKKMVGINNLHLVEGNFDHSYRKYIDTKPIIDFAFIDGNHREEATVKYFEWTLEASHENTVIVFDDIHWSQGMLNAWNTIIAHPSVTASIDMYMMGIVFLKKDFKEIRHLKIRPVKW